MIAVTSIDPVLSYVGSVGMAMAAGSGLVVDLCDTGSRNRSLADLDADGPRLEELSPGRQGIAVLAGGPVDRDRAAQLVFDLAERWPVVVVRVSSPPFASPCVPLVPLYPGRLSPSGDEPAAWQPVGPVRSAPGPGPVLPPLPSRLTRQVLAARHPRHCRWTKAVARLWDLPWD